jgi:hypothetical protein
MRSYEEDRASRARFLKVVCETHEANVRKLRPWGPDEADLRRLRRGSSLITRIIAGGVAAGNRELDRTSRRAVRARGR